LIHFAKKLDSQAGKRSPNKDGGEQLPGWWMVTMTTIFLCHSDNLSDPSELHISRFPFSQKPARAIWNLKFQVWAKFPPSVNFWNLRLQDSPKRRTLPDLFSRGGIQRTTSKFWFSDSVGFQSRNWSVSSGCNFVT
jgi:hypothetical protein